MRKEKFLSALLAAALVLAGCASAPRQSQTQASASSSSAVPAGRNIRRGCRR